MLQHLLLVFLLFYIHDASGGVGMLYPRDSEARQSKFLDGIWHFRADSSLTRNQGFVEKWWTVRLYQTGPVIDMPVPSSYNDVTEDRNLRDFVGWVWYDQEFYVTSDWATNRRIVLRFDSAHYNTIVWLNGQQACQHEGGHLPFEGEIQNLLKFDGHNYVTVAVNNTLTPTTLPPGSLLFETDTSMYPPGYFVQKLQMDFFNYAGIHRHVRLYTTPQTYIDDITILTNVDQGKGVVNYTVVVTGGATSSVQINILDANKNVVATSNKLSDVLTVSSPQLWWPYGMNSSSVGYLYKLEVKITNDVYRQPFGIRTIRVTGNQFLINEKPFYCQGVAKHEDSDFRGKGLDYTLITKDFNMLRWLGVNCIRTSHYPYAEEILELADRQGVAIIDESPGVGIRKIENFGNVSLQHHIQVMSEMIRRDKNKPSVIMWSVANEPSSGYEGAVPYFKSVIEFTRNTDPAHRPTTFVSAEIFENDRVVQFVDVICINLYYAWYQDEGHVEVIQLQLQREFAGFRNLYNKPIIVTEYGADTVPGLHMEPSLMFTEDYQVEFLEEYHKGFDKARQQFLVGEMVWNFADFMTIEGISRVVGNRKGLLTRQRQPKAAAHAIRKRYHGIASGGNDTCSYRGSSKYSTSPHMYDQLP